MDHLVQTADSIHRKGENMLSEEIQKTRDRLIAQQNKIVDPLPIVQGSYTSISAEKKTTLATADLALQLEINELSDQELISKAQNLAELFPNLLNVRKVSINSRELILDDENNWRVLPRMNSSKRE